MKSHEYRFAGKEVLVLAAAPLLVVTLLAIAVHAAARFNLLPPPRPALDVDRTILLHQADASRKKSDASIILIGDSSCLMNVNARELAQELGTDVLNLATLSHVPLQWQSQLATNFLANNTASPKTVLLMMHPESLRLSAREPYFARILESYFHGDDFRPLAQPQLPDAAGAGIIRGRLLSRAMPIPLPGVYGTFYGFAQNLEIFMDENAGSAIDPRSFNRASYSGSAEFRLARQLEGPSIQLRNVLPEGVRLVVGITPSPETLALPSHHETCQEMLEEWSAWLGADATLELPFTLPDHLFASSAHLNQEGMSVYTRMLAAFFRSEIAR